MRDTSRRNPFGILVITLSTIGIMIVLSPFWQATFWAIVLGVLFWPQREKWAALLGGRSTAASSLIVLFILLFVLVPTFLIVGLIADGALVFIEKVQSGGIQPIEAFSSLQARFPKLENFLLRVGVDLESARGVLSNGFLASGKFVLSNMIAISQSASAFAFHVFILLYLVFALLQHGDKIYSAVFDAIPLTRHQKTDFFLAFAEMAAATIKGMIAVGLVQGLLGAFIFWLVGIDDPAFWGAVMGLMSIIPPFGAGFIWGPAGVFLALNGSPTQGLILLVFGVGVISMSDNIVRPIIVGRASCVPGYLVLVTTLGGLGVFGLTGLVLGPVVAALFLTSWQLLAELQTTPVPQERPDDGGAGAVTNSAGDD